MACIPGLRTNFDCNFVLNLIAWVEAYYITKTEKMGSESGARVENRRVASTSFR